MSQLSAEQRRYIDNVVLIAARILAFRALKQSFKSDKLLNLVLINNGKGLKEEDRVSDGKYEVFSSSGLIGHHSDNLSDEGFVVIGRKGSAGKTTLAPRGGWVIDTAYYAQPLDKHALDLEYLYFAISSLDFTSDVIATAIPGINRTSIYQHEIPIPPIHIQRSCVEFLIAAEQRMVQSLGALPPPLDQQQRIVAHIDAIAAQLSAARALRQHALDEASAVLSSAMLNLFSSYENIVLSKLIAADSTISYGVLVPGADVADGVPFVRVQDLTTREHAPFPNKRIEAGIEASYLRTRLKGNEVLLGVVGSIGKVGTVPQHWRGANIARAVCRLEPGEKITQRYLAWVLQSTTVQTYFMNSTRTLAQPTLNVGFIATTPIPVPPLDEQRRIVDYLDNLQAQVDALKQLQAQSAAEMDALLPSLLDRAFAGQL